MWSLHDVFGSNDKERDYKHHSKQANCNVGSHGRTVLAAARLSFAVCLFLLLLGFLGCHHCCNVNRLPSVAVAITVVTVTLAVVSAAATTSAAAAAASVGDDR